MSDQAAGSNVERKPDSSFRVLQLFKLRNSSTAATAFIAAIQLLVVAILLLPVIWLYVGAFRSELDIRSGNLLPSTLTTANFGALFSQPLVWTGLVNSLLVAAGACVVTTAVATSAAYGLTRFRFRGRNAAAALLLTAQAIPAVVVLVPLVLMIRSVGLANSLPGMTIVDLELGIPVGVFLLRNYFAQIPVAIEEAATLDGCSRLQALWFVVLPLLRPAIVSVAAFSFILAWGEYLMALALLSSDEVKTLPLVMQTLFDRDSVRLGPILAFGVVISLPVVALFMLVQRNLTSNLTAGGVK